MQRLEVSGAVRPIYGSLGIKRLMNYTIVYVVCECLGLTKKKKKSKYMFVLQSGRKIKIVLSCISVFRLLYWRGKDKKGLRQHEYPK